MLTSALLALALAADAPQVTLPLDEYRRLQTLEERPALTVVDLLRVEGSFAARDLALVFTGRASGRLPTAAVLAGDGFRVHSCQGEALVSRGDAGGFELTPLAPRFQVRCRVALDGSDRLAAEASRAVLEVQSAVGDGELVASDSGAGRTFAVVRRIGGAREELPPSVAGRYRVTLLPDEARFLYRLEVRNPARTHRRFEVTLREVEHVESIDAPVAWDVEGGRYRFDVPPGESTLVFTGRLTAGTFVPPVEASVQYLLLESHPLIRPDVAEGARRVGAGETGLDATYRGAQAFLLDGRGEIRWTSTRLEALKTAGFSIGAQRQVFFLGADGNARSEVTLDVDNQGAPALTLPPDGTVGFASVGGEPAFLGRDAEGRLFLPLGPGRQEVVVQDTRPFRNRLGIAVARLDLARPGAPASRAQVELRYPSEWIPLYEELAPSARLHLAGGPTVLVLAALALLAERLLALSGVTRRRRLALTAALVLLAALSPDVRIPAVLAAGLPLAALGAVLVVRRLSGALRVLALAGGGLALVIAFVTVAALSVVSRLEQGELGSGPGAYASNALDEEEASGVLAKRAPRAPGAALATQGLPARIDLPSGARQAHFHRELLAPDASRPVVVVLVAARLAAAMGWGAALLLAVLALAWRRDLAAGGRIFAARLGSERAGAAAAAR